MRSSMRRGKAISKVGLKMRNQSKGTTYRREEESWSFSKAKSEKLIMRKVKAIYRKVTIY
jgi:hypothetical protein